MLGLGRGTVFMPQAYHMSMKIKTALGSRIDIEELMKRARFLVTVADPGRPGDL
jgi:hypothetical protein